MNALELLKADHKKVKALFQQAEAAEESQLEEICQHIKTELETHAHIEETVFYPAMEKYDELKEMVQESREGHQEIKTQLEELIFDDELKSQLEALMETVEHHAEDEEEGEMFPKILELIDIQELQKIGDQLQAAKGQFQQQRKAG
jgi:hemerythrin HHE cation binding domain-containing protein